MVCQLNNFLIKKNEKKGFICAILKDKGFKQNKKIMIKNQVLQINIIRDPKLIFLRNLCKEYDFFGVN